MSPSNDRIAGLRSGPRSEKRPSSNGFISIDETSSLADHSQPDYDPTVGAKPYSPFYRHATPTTAEHPRLTLDATELGTRDEILRELEKGEMRYQETEDTGNRRESKLWAEKRRHCDCMRALSRRQRITIKAVIAVVILGSMVAIALGITAAVGGGVWRSAHRQSEIG